jgi:hypothetical protein
LQGGEGRNRTGDTTVFSRVLYQLSYLAALAQCSRAGYEEMLAAGAGLGPAGGHDEPDDGN